MASESRLYADAWNASPLAILTLDEEGIVFSANPAAELIFSMDEKGLQGRSEEHTSELQSRRNLVCRLLLEKKKAHV